MTSIPIDLMSAASVPKISHVYRLVAIAQLAGGKVVPQSHWDSLGALLSQIRDSGTLMDHAGFGGFNLRSSGGRDDVEGWQYNLVLEDLEMAEANGHHVWFVPVEEIIYATSDEEPEDDGTYHRLIWVGPESEIIREMQMLLVSLREAVADTVHGS